MKTIKPLERADTDEALLSGIKNGNDESLVKVYKLHRNNFIHWAINTYGIDEEIAADMFQDTLIVLHRNIMKGKLVELTSTLKTYIYGIGKNLIKERLQKDKKYVNNVELMEHHPGTFVHEKDRMESDDRKKIVMNLLEKLGEPCRSILRLYYFKSYSMESIAECLNYKSDDVVKTQKSRCLNELKKQVKAIYKKDDLL